MKLTQLNLTNFRSARGLSLDVDAPRIFIAGLEGAGKTSLREAIRWTLRGVCDATDLKGAGAELLAPHGSSEVSTSLVIDGIGTVSRLHTERGGTAFTVEGFTGTTQVQQQALHAKLGTTPAYLDACLNTETFLRLHHADAKALVLALLDVKVPVPDGEQTVLRTLDEIEVLYKDAFERRKLVKRQLQVSPPVPEPKMSDSLKDAFARTKTTEVADLIAFIRGKLGDLEKVVQERQRAVGEVQGTRKALEAEHTRLQAVLMTPLPDLTADAERLSELSTQSVAPTPPGERPPISLASGRRMELLSTHHPSKGCVLDSEVPCKTPAKAFHARVEALQAEITAARKPAPPAAPSPTTGIQAEMAAIEARIKARTDLVRQQEQAKVRLDALTQELAALPDMAEAEQTLAERQGLLAQGLRKLDEALDYQRAQEAVAEAKRARADLEAQVEALERQVELLGPKGLRVEALAKAVSGFEAAINRSLAAWGWTLSFVVEPWTVLVNGRPVETFSRSERWRIGIGIQLAVAALSGLSFAVVDDLDMLTAANKRTLAAMVDAAPLDQIFVLGTREPEQGLPRATARWMSYRLVNVDGQTQVQEVVPRSAAA